MTKASFQKLLFSLLVLGGLVYVNAQYVAGPLTKKFNDSKQKYIADNQKLTDLISRASAQRQLELDMARLEKEVADLEQLLPRERDLPVLLRTVTRRAQSNGLKITQFTPGKLTAMTNYNEIPFEMTLQGGFHGLGRFLADIGQEPRILSVRNLSLSQMTGPTRDSGITISIQLTLVAFTFKS